jgi:hypothetical protein
MPINVDWIEDMVSVLGFREDLTQLPDGKPARDNADLVEILKATDGQRNRRVKLAEQHHTPIVRTTRKRALPLCICS